MVLGLGERYAGAKACGGAVGYEPFGSLPSHISDSPSAFHCPHCLLLHPCLQEVSAV